LLCFVLQNWVFIYSVYFYGTNVCGCNHEHCLVKYFFPLVLCFCTMSSYPPISLPFGFTYDACSLMWSTNGSNIFVDYCCSNELCIDSYFFIINVHQFHVFSPLKCNPNLFGHFFYPYISLNLDEYDIPLNSCFSINYFMHPS
jgi:hypothetical protein